MWMVCWERLITSVENVVVGLMLPNLLLADDLWAGVIMELITSVVRMMVGLMHLNSLIVDGC